jgi:hypothetical protein
MFQVMRTYPYGSPVATERAAVGIVEYAKSGDVGDCAYYFEVRGCSDIQVYRSYPVFPARATIAECIEDTDAAMRDGCIIHDNCTLSIRIVD